MQLPRGFRFGSSAAGIKPDGALDLALIAADQPATMAGVYTQNVVCATSIDWNRKLTPSASFRGLVINSGNANACTGSQGQRDNQRMAETTASCLNADANQIGVLSTGVIGVHLPIANVLQSIPGMVESAGNVEADFHQASRAIMTSDQGPKTVQRKLNLRGEFFHVAAMAKGAGMIGPNMATMLAVICVDAFVLPETAQAMARRVADQSFNRISVEGHTSTNDAMMLLFSQQTSELSIEQNDDLETELVSVCTELAKKIPSDGEGATHLIEVAIDGAASDAEADRIARTVAASNLVKTAVTGADPNWGRIVSAAGYCDASIELSKTTLAINGFVVFREGEPITFDQAVVSQSMQSEFETQIELRVGNGDGAAIHWSSDLTTEYVRFNSEYTT
ncbi:MAG: bifunctional glutamate N-acetyltransferase/amino-acid acetyltransferase ArgJ [Planctomycetota bacterium]